MRQFIGRVTPLQVVIFLGAWIPVVLLVTDYYTGKLSINPIQDVEQRTGRLAILWVVFTLVCTPLNSLFGWREPIKRRRAVGLYAFMFASLHVLTFLALDYGLDIELILDVLLEKKFIIVGATAFLLLLLLAGTSFDYWKKRLKKNWKRLHWAVYAIAPLVVLHYAWAKKGDIFRLQGDIVQPLIYGIVVLVLLGVRIKPIKRTIAVFITRLAAGIRKQMSVITK